VKNGGEKKVLVLVSGGVDSSVCCALVAKAVGRQRCIALHINNGFMRKQESEQVVKSLSALDIDVHYVDASTIFYNSTKEGDSNGEKLSETVNPELKRQIIGDTFVKVANREILNLHLDPNNVFLAQGTLRPDLIESASHLASGKADKIKTHHNDTELVRALRAAGGVIEPLSEYHKDEIRELGLILGLPPELVWRQPFPGPGLAVRIVCSHGIPPYPPEFVQTNVLLAQLTDFKLNQEALRLRLISAGMMNLEKKLLEISGKLRATLLPIKTVGVQGDARTYSNCAVLSTTGDSDQIDDNPDWESLFFLANTIPKLCHDVNRVVFAFGREISQVLSSEVTPTYLTPDVIQKLQEADAIVNRILLQRSLTKILSQVPVILFPVNFGIPNSHSIAIRTIITADFMTGVPARPGIDIEADVVPSMVKAVLAEVPAIARVVYDLTSKPPATTEWE